MLARMQIQAGRRARPIVAVVLFALGPAPSLYAGEPWPTPPPPAPVREVRDTYFGNVVVDPYRWLEQQHAPEAEKWVRAQDAYARAVLARIPGRDALRERVAALTGADVSIQDVARARSRWFYLERAPGWDNYKLMARDGEVGAERVLFDPEKAAGKDAPHLSIDYVAPSPDGKLVALGASPGGSEDSALYLLDAATGRVVDGPIDRAQNGSPAWRDDGRALFYVRRQVLTADMPETARYQNRHVFLHRVGAPVGEDVLVLGHDVAGSPAIGLDESPFVVPVFGTSYLLGFVVPGARRELRVYVAKVAGTPRAMPAWQRLCDLDDEIVDVTAHGGDAYLLSHKGASRYQLLRTSLAHPDPAHASVVIPASRAVLTGVTAASDGLYVVSLDGGLNRLWRVPYGQGKPTEVALPFAATLRGWSSEPDRPGVIFSLQGWTHAPGRFESDGKTVTLLRFSPPSRVDMSSIASEEVMARSHDGTEVPLSILHRRDVPLDGNNPTLLDGYGAYGIARQPAFSPSALAWLERGGVYAVAHVRGGGEFGEDWHKAGQKTTKQHTIDDFIACAEYLIAQRWTRPARLAGQGTSAGGITIAGAITQRPELFGAALIRVGDSDILRTEFATDGPGNAQEYGTVKIKEELETMLRISGYHNVKQGVAYPAVLLTGGFNDPRVALYQSSKMAARLQAATASKNPILLRVEFDAGHGVGSTKSQRDAQWADEMAFLLWRLGVPEQQPK
jgi:prolyl oligopeptidase